VEQLLWRVGDVEQTGSIMRPMVRAEEVYEYRNKVEFHYGLSATAAPPEGTSAEAGGAAMLGGPVLGLKEPGAHQTVVDIQQCLLQNEVVNNAKLNAGARLVVRIL
jgi:tRNA/tmRNA/rRNA uracil-C5-methylase (TrmA/RlmC/RlmD family)